MTRPVARISKKKNVTVSILKTLVKKLERQNAHQRRITNSQADHIIQTELMRRAVIDNHQSFEVSKERILELEAENKEMGEEMTQVNQENLRLRDEIQNATSTVDDLRKRMELLEQENSRLRMKGEFHGRLTSFESVFAVITVKQEINDENREVAGPVKNKPRSYVYDENNGPVPQVVKEASAAHFFYRGHFSKKANYTRWSDLGTAKRDEWTEEWEKIKEVQKVQAAQGLIVLKSQIKEEVEDERKWAMVLRSRH